MRFRILAVCFIALALTAGACSSSGGGGSSPSYADLASQLRSGLRGNVWVMNVQALDEEGVIDRRGDGELYPAMYEQILDGYAGHSAIPGPWSEASARAFAWPDTAVVLGAVPEDADVIVTDTVSSVLLLPDVIDDVEATLEDADAWQGSDSAGGGTWTWDGDPELAESEEPGTADLEQTLAVGEYQATIDDDALVLTSQRGDVGSPAEPILELLDDVADAHLAAVFDGCRGLQAQYDGAFDEPVGGYLDPVLAVAYTVTWSDGDPSEEMQMLFAEGDAAADAATSLETTIAADGDVTEILGTGAIVSVDDRVVTIARGTGGRETDLAITVRNALQAGHRSVGAFATEDQCEPVGS